MTKFNYRDEMKNEILEYLDELADAGEDLEDCDSDRIYELICENAPSNILGKTLYEDSPYSDMELREHVLENEDTLREVIYDYELDPKEIVTKFLRRDWAFFDNWIREYCIFGAIQEALDEYRNGLPK